jgi:hypothetical protein
MHWKASPYKQVINFNLADHKLDKVKILSVSMRTWEYLLPHRANAKAIVANYQPNCHMNIFPA